MRGLPDLLRIQIYVRTMQKSEFASGPALFTTLFKADNLRQRRPGSSTEHLGPGRPFALSFHIAVWLKLLLPNPRARDVYGRGR